MTPKRALEKAIEIAGGPTALGNAVGAGHSHVYYWLNTTGRVPAEKVLPIEIATDRKVTRHQLRPDLYPMEGK